MWRKTGWTDWHCSHHYAQDKKSILNHTLLAVVILGFVAQAAAWSWAPRGHEGQLSDHLAYSSSFVPPTWRLTAFQTIVFASKGTEEVRGTSSFLTGSFEITATIVTAGIWMYKNAQLSVWKIIAEKGKSDSKEGYGLSSIPGVSSPPWEKGLLLWYLETEVRKRKETQSSLLSVWRKLGEHTLLFSFTPPSRTGLGQNQKSLWEKGGAVDRRWRKVPCVCH